jgi:hypothetical protein
LLSFTLSSWCSAADKQTFPRLDVIGWYATGTAVGVVEMDIQRKASNWKE